MPLAARHAATRAGDHTEHRRARAHATTPPPHTHHMTNAHTHKTMHTYRMHTDNIGRQHRSHDCGSQDSTAHRTSSGRTTCHSARRRRTSGPEFSLWPFPIPPNYNRSSFLSLPCPPSPPLPSPSHSWPTKKKRLVMIKSLQKMRKWRFLCGGEWRC